MKLGFIASSIRGREKRDCKKKQRFFSTAALQFANNTLESIDQSED